MEPTLQQLFDQAVPLHQAGRMAEAEPLYRQILARQPSHPDALHLLGVLAHQVGQHAPAAELIRQSIAQRPNWHPAYLNLGAALLGAGKPEEAVVALERAVALAPNPAEALHTVAGILQTHGRREQAVAAYQRAAALRPDWAQPWGDFGTLLYEMGRVEQAIDAYRRAGELRPDWAAVFTNMGAALVDVGRFDEALNACQRAVALAPELAEAHNNFGNALKEKGRFAEAVTAYRQALKLRPQLPEACNNLGVSLLKQGLTDQAITAFNQAIALRPSYGQAYSNLGSALISQRRYFEAIDVLNSAVRIDPRAAGAPTNLGVALQHVGRLDEAIVMLRRSIGLDPGVAQSFNNLGNTLILSGQLDLAADAYCGAIALRPNDAEAHSNFVYTQLFHPGFDAAAIADQLKQWNRQHAEPLKPRIQPHRNDRDPNRRLRIGYVSPDFWDHVVGRNLLPLFHQHDHEQFEITCYANVSARDAVTDEFQQQADRWRPIFGLSDEKAAQQIRDDGIDILIDTSLHLAGNRLLVFAQKPAPVQVTFAGYPGSTGLRTIDYRLSDPYLDPPETDSAVYSEKTFRLPHSFWCYDPLSCREVAVGELPAQNAGFITFGCLNNFCKISQPTLDLWARALAQVPNSRLLLLAHPGSHRQRTIDYLLAQGVEAGRVEFVAPQPRGAYLRQYHRIDIGLDTLPYNGHSTSLDSLWMGVPVVTLVGNTVVGRAGFSQLSNLKLTELAAQKPEEFVQIAANLARDLPRLESLRASLRPQMEQSPLTDAVGFACGIESAYRQMWRAWCQGCGPASEIA
jgi:predicted O-linked N-acetylglucosamine transferase (SPINDLY family)